MDVFSHFFLVCRNLKDIVVNTLSLLLYVIYNTYSKKVFFFITILANVEFIEKVTFIRVHSVSIVNIIQFSVSAYQNG